MTPTDGGAFVPPGSHLEFTEDDNSRILVVSLLLFVLGIQAVPHHLKHRSPECSRHHKICSEISKSASSSTDLISTGNFLHLPERCVELADEIVLPPGVIIPHEALWHTHTHTHRSSLFLLEGHNTQQYSWFFYFFYSTLKYCGLLFCLWDATLVLLITAVTDRVPWACARHHSCTRIWETLWKAPTQDSGCF